MQLHPHTTNDTQASVLIVEDDGISRFILSKWLSLWKVSADYCHNATSGLQALKAHSYKLAIIDHYLPDFTGVELIQQIRQQPGPPPTFALHSTDTELYFAARQYDIDYFLPKPFSSGSLYNILRESSCRPQPVEQPSAERLSMSAEIFRRRLSLSLLAH